jgi:hypothetical protein
MIFTHPELDGDFLIKKVERHLNGETGEPFHTVAFRSEAGDLVGVLFDAEKHIAIIDPDFPSLRFRGDDFEDVLRQAIAQWEDE